MRRSVVFFFGGQSSEHGISCLTAAGVVRALDREKFDASAVGITPDGTWLRYTADEVAALEIVDGQLPEVKADDGRELALLVRRGDRVVLASVTDGSLTNVVDVDVAFALLHGPFGEDGTIQGQFEMLGLPYVGAGVASSAIGMDKHLMKVMLEAEGLPVGPHVAFTKSRWQTDQQACIDLVATLDYPVYVKPARGGSSLGINRVTSPDGLAEAVEIAIEHDPKVVVEQGINGAREIECAVLGGRGGAGPRASLPGEIVMHTEDGFYDYEAKYFATGQVDLKVPADLDDETLARVRDLAARTFTALDTEGLGRVDTFVLPDGQVLINEINTMPGFTQFSMFPTMWDATGISYPDLITDLIDQAIERGTGLR